MIDRSVIADVYGRPDAFNRNVDFEYRRNRERYQFLRWGQTTLNEFTVVPPGTGIVHQVNIEHLARVVIVRDGVAHPDKVVDDSHTTMVNGLGVLGWGVGGIEATWPPGARRLKVEGAGVFRDAVGRPFPTTLWPRGGTGINGFTPGFAASVEPSE